jgi:cytochrome c oxidase subunit 3
MIAMGQVLPYRPPKAREETTAFIGMVIFLASWAMMFAAMFFAYGFVRTRANTWPPVDLPVLPVLLPAFNTLVLAASSATFQYGLSLVRGGAGRRLGLALLATFILGAVFLFLQGWLWAGLYGKGLRPDTGGPYSSVFYGLTAFHAVHVLVGLGAIGVLCGRALAGAFSAARHLPVRLWAMYWHFVGVVWAVMFILVFAI